MSSPSPTTAAANTPTSPAMAASRRKLPAWWIEADKRDQGRAESNESASQESTVFDNPTKQAAVLIGFSKAAGALRDYASSVKQGVQSMRQWRRWTKIHNQLRKLTGDDRIAREWLEARAPAMLKARRMKTLKAMVKPVGGAAAILGAAYMLSRKVKQKREGKPFETPAWLKPKPGEETDTGTTP